MGSRERVPVGRVHVHGGGVGRPARVAAVGARQRLPVGPSHVPVRGKRRALRVIILGSRERRTRSLLEILVMVQYILRTPPPLYYGYDRHDAASSSSPSASPVSRSKSSPITSPFFTACSDA
jgi:hypothetical protein